MRQIITATFMGMRVASLSLVVYWMIIFAGTHYPKMRLPGFHWADKVYHFVAYAGLAVLLSWAIPNREENIKRNVWIAIGIAFVYGAADEFSQSFIRGRTADVYDFLADCAGALAGACAYMALRHVLRFRFRKPARLPNVGQA